jgi:hypothetical protein
MASLEQEGKSDQEGPANISLAKDIYQQVFSKHSSGHMECWWTQGWAMSGEEIYSQGSI